MRIGEKWKRQKSKQQRRHPPKSCIFNRRYLKLFINTNNPWTVYLCQPQNNWCSSNLLTSLQNPPRMPIHTSEVSLVNLIIQEGKQYPEILFVSLSKYLSRYHHCHNHFTPLLCYHVTLSSPCNSVNPLFWMYHHNHFTPIPLNVDHRLFFM